MKIKIVCQLQTSGYSGGRYYAIMLAAGLSKQNEVHFYTNSPNNQIYKECFGYANIKFFSYNNLDLNQEYDFSIIFPGGERNFHLHDKMLEIAKFKSAKTYLFSFETENWWNSFSIQNKDSNIWLPWKKISKHVDGIICVSKECVDWAREYYEKDDDFPMFGIEGPINTVICDSVEVKKINQVCFFTRIGINSSHKGFKYLNYLNRESLSGFSIRVIFGGNKPSHTEESKFKSIFEKNNINLDFYNNIVEKEKFKLIKQSKILFYPELFTGFGLPPLESLYCETRPICFEIPVIKKNDVGLFKYMYEDTMGKNIDDIVDSYFFSEEEKKILNKFKKDINLYNYCESFINKIRSL
jgi:hypothetical protein